MPVIDLHCDTIDKLYTDQSSLLSNSYHIDLNKLKAGEYSAQWFALFIDMQVAQKPLMQLVREMYDYFMDQISLNKDFIELAKNFKEYKEIKSKHKVAAFLSLEEGQIIEGNLDNIKKLYDKGENLTPLLLLRHLSHVLF